MHMEQDDFALTCFPVINAYFILVKGYGALAELQW